MTQLSSQTAGMAELVKGQAAAVMDLLKSRSQAQTASSFDAEDFSDMDPFSKEQNLSEDFVIQKATAVDFEDVDIPPPVGISSSAAKSDHYVDSVSMQADLASSSSIADAAATASVASSIEVGMDASPADLGFRTSADSESQERTATSTATSRTTTTSAKVDSEASHSQGSSQKQNFSSFAKTRRNIVPPPTQTVRIWVSCVCQKVSL